MTRSVPVPNQTGSNHGEAAKKKFRLRNRGGPKNGVYTGMGFPNPPGGGGGARGLSPNDRGQRYGASGGFPGVRYGDALSLVNAQLKGSINEVRNERQKVRRETQAERQRANSLYSRSVGDINHVFGETGDYIGSQNQAIQQNYGGLTDRTTQAQAALMQHLQQSGTDTASGVTSELARLGIQGSPGMNAGNLDQFAADQSFVEGQAAIGGQNQLANIGAQQTAAGDVGQLLMGMNAGGQASALGQAASAKSQAMFEAEANKKSAVEQLRRAMKDLRMSRPDLVRQMLEQILQSRWGMYMDSQNLGLQKEQLNLQRAAQRAYHSKSYGSGSSSGGGQHGSTSPGYAAPSGSSGSGSSGSGSNNPGVGGSSGSAGSAGNAGNAGGDYGDLVTQILNGGGWSTGGKKKR